MELRRSPRFNPVGLQKAVQVLSNEVREDIRLFQLMTDADRRINALTQLYKKLAFKFDVFYCESTFLRSAYRHTFLLFRDALALKDRDKLNQMRKEFSKYRRRYEKRRHHLWCVKNWKVILPIDIINIIDTFM